MKNNFCIIIPARLKSKRLPNKPLINFKNKTLIQHTLEGIGKNFNIHDIYIFTDSKSATEKIKESIDKKYKNVFTIKNNCLNGTERCSYGIKYLRKKYDGYLILSCDFVGINWKLIKKVFLLFNQIKKNKNFAGTTAHVKIKNKKIYADKSVAKLAVNLNNEIMYISRNQIPSNYKKKVIAYSHHGPVCLKKKHLNIYKYLKNTNSQLSEDNEWLKIIENGYKIKSVLVSSITQEINNLKDLYKLRKNDV